MIFKNHKLKWQVIGESVRGDLHESQGLPNQDSISYLPESGVGSPLILAVADGHGCRKCFRSDIGANLAVTTVIKVFQDFLKTLPKTTNASTIKHWVEEKLPRTVVHCWMQAVADDLSIKPFTISELNQIEAKEGINKRRQIVFEPIIAYGTTILAVLVTESFIIYLQLGDGDILTVSEAGKVTKPLPSDSRLFANETTSLCTQEAWRDFRVYVQPILDQPHALILLSTDGYSNSFRDDESFLKVGTDILEIIRSEGLDEVNKNLKSWLIETSQNGSGDDITLGIICRTEIQKKSNLKLPFTQKEKTEELLTSKVLEASTRLPFKSIIEDQ